MQTFIHTDNKMRRRREIGSIPRLFLLVELPVLDLVVEAGRLLAGDRVLNGIGSDGTITLSNSPKKARTTDFPAYSDTGYSDTI